VVPAYWLKATGAASQALRTRLRELTQWRALLDVQRLDVFGTGVDSRHMVFAVERASESPPSSVAVYRAQPDASLWDVERAVRRGASEPNVSRSEASPDSVYGARGEILLGLGLDPRERQLLIKLQSGSLPAGWILSEGITANPEHLTARGIAAVQDEEGIDLRARGLAPGDPVFVVPHGWERLQELTERERDQHLLPYLRPKAIRRLRAHPPSDAPWLIYTTRGNVQEASEIPTLTAHLALAREVLERRRETRRGSRQWFHLHWPRREALLDGPRVLVPRMTVWPSASLIVERCATGESVFTLVPADRRFSALASALLGSLPFALGILLSTKSRGKGIDISRAALASCPWPEEECFAAAVNELGDRPGDFGRWLDTVEEGAAIAPPELLPLARVAAAAERLADRFPETGQHEGPWGQHSSPRVARLGAALDAAACELLSLPMGELRPLAKRTFNA
jgi:hypothetical protein